MNATRRTILYATPAFLAACGTTGTVDVTQAIADAGIITNGIAGVVQSLVTLGRISPAQQISIAGYISTARIAQAQLSASASALNNVTNLQGVEDAINAALPILSAIPGLPPEITVGIVAAQVLLPIIEATIAQLLNKPPKVSAARQAMSPDSARAVLLKAAGR
jgi:hypothetical protein